MGYLSVSLGGGGADLSVITAESADVLAGEIIVDKDGEPVAGTMPDKSGTALTVATNKKTLIPKGYHDGTEYASNTQATMAGQTITPSSAKQTVSCSGKLMNGNVVVNAIPSNFIEFGSSSQSFDFATISNILGGIVANYVNEGSASSVYTQSAKTVEYVDGVPNLSCGSSDNDYLIVFKKPVHLSLLSEISLTVGRNSSTKASLGIHLISLSKLRLDRVSGGATAGTSDVVRTVSRDSEWTDEWAYIGLKCDNTNSKTEMPFKSLKFTLK